MKRLTKSEITNLRRSASQLERGSLYSCIAVKINAGNEMSDRYADALGVNRYEPAELTNDIPNVNWQLARSLAVLMFIESNK